MNNQINSWPLVHEPIARPGASHQSTASLVGCALAAKDDSTNANPASRAYFFMAIGSGAIRAFGQESIQSPCGRAHSTALATI